MTVARERVVGRCGFAVYGEDCGRTVGEECLVLKCD